MARPDPKEILLDEALAATPLAPGFCAPAHEQSANRIDSPSLLEALLAGAYASGQLALDKPLVNQLEKLPDPVSLAPSLVNRLYLLDILYEQLETQASLDPAILAFFYQLRPTLLRATLGTDTFIKSSRHPLRKALDELCYRSIGWDKSMGKNGEKLLDQLKSLAHAITGMDPTTTTLPAAVETALQALQESAQRHELIESRLCQSEQGAMESLRAKRITDHAINAQMENLELPPPMIQFFHGPWRDSLHRKLLMHGTESKDWQLALQLMERLVFCLAPTDDEKHKQEKYKLIASIRLLLEKHLSSLGSDAEKFHWLDEVEEHIKKVLVGTKIPCESVPRLSSLETDGVSTHISTAMSQQVSRLQPGQWVLYKMEDGSIVRGKLAMISPEAQQLLFVNLLGAKRFVRNTEEFAYAIHAKKIRLLVSKGLFSLLLTRSIELLIKRYQSLADKTAPENKVVEALKHQSAEKARIEAERLLQNQKELDLLARESAQNATPAQKPAALLADNQEQTEALVRALRIGAWLSMKNRLGEQMPCKIAVIYNSTGKMVIVDKSGLRVGEYLRGDIVQLIMQGEVRILEQSDSFESSLARVIQTLRKDS